MLSLLRSMDRWNLILWPVADYHDRGKVVRVNHTSGASKFVYISLASPNFRITHKYYKPITYLKGNWNIIMAQF